MLKCSQFVSLIMKQSKQVQFGSKDAYTEGKNIKNQREDIEF